MLAIDPMPRHSRTTTLRTTFVISVVLLAFSFYGQEEAVEESDTDEVSETESPEATEDSTAEESETNDEDSADNTTESTEEATSTEDTTESDDPDIFNPTEEISEDVPIPFPVDI